MVGCSAFSRVIARAVDGRGRRGRWKTSLSSPWAFEVAARSSTSIYLGQFFRCLYSAQQSATVSRHFDTHVVPFSLPFDALTLSTHDCSVFSLISFLEPNISSTTPISSASCALKK
jgi:hypothetical protein